MNFCGHTARLQRCNICLYRCISVIVSINFFWHIFHRFGRFLAHIWPVNDRTIWQPWKIGVHEAVSTVRAKLPNIIGENNLILEVF